MPVKVVASYFNVSALMRREAAVPVSSQHAVGAPQRTLALSGEERGGFGVGMTQQALSGHDF